MSDNIDKKAEEAREARRDALYGTLTDIGDKWCYQEDLYRKMSDYYPPLDGRRYHDSTARLLMSADISAINRSPKYRRIIVSTPKGVKLATREEARAMISGRQGAVMRELHDVNVLLRKFERDGQTAPDGETVSAFVGG